MVIINRYHSNIIAIENDPRNGNSLIEFETWADMACYAFGRALSKLPYAEAERLILKMRAELDEEDK